MGACAAKLNLYIWQFEGMTSTGASKLKMNMLLVCCLVMDRYEGRCYDPTRELQRPQSPDEL